MNTRGVHFGKAVELGRRALPGTLGWVVCCDQIKEDRMARRAKITIVGASVAQWSAAKELGIAVSV